MRAECPLPRSTGPSRRRPPFRVKPFAIAARFARDSIRGDWAATGIGVGIEGILVRRGTQIESGLYQRETPRRAPPPSGGRAHACLWRSRRRRHRRAEQVPCAAARRPGHGSPVASPSAPPQARQFDEVARRWRSARRLSLIESARLICVHLCHLRTRIRSSIGPHDRLGTWPLKCTPGAGILPCREILPHKRLIHEDRHLRTAATEGGDGLARQSDRGPLATMGRTDEDHPASKPSWPTPGCGTTCSFAWRTDTGLTGIGEATLEWQEKTVQTLLPRMGRGRACWAAIRSTSRRSSAA